MLRQRYKKAIPCSVFKLDLQAILNNYEYSQR